jgi:hypothetical protein
MNPKSPFYILELSSKATPGEIERQGRKLLGLFEVGAAKAATYVCPLGSFPRDPTMVREAMAALRDPARRKRESVLVALLETAPAAPEAQDVEALDAPLVDAFLAGGYLGL